METQHSGQLSCIKSRTLWSLMLICVYFNTCIVYWNWISKYGAVFILNLKKIDKIKKKKIHSVFVMYSCILYTVHVFQKNFWRGIWFGFPLFWQQLFLSWHFQALLSSVCFRKWGQQTLHATKPLDFIIRQNWSPGQERN